MRQLLQGNVLLKRFLKYVNKAISLAKEKTFATSSPNVVVGDPYD
jgi:hypothetical protein